MGKIFRTIFMLFLLYYMYEFAFIIFDSGHHVTYSIKSKGHTFNIEEVAHTNLKEDNDNYSFTIKVGNSEFKYSIFNDFKKYSYVIKSLDYYKDSSYECLFVRYSNNKPINDVLCKYKNELIYYNNMENPSESLRKFVGSLEDYDVYKYSDGKEVKNYGGILLYEKNLLDNHYVSVGYGNGLYRVNPVDKINNVKIYDTELDISKIKVGDFVGNKYITFNYEVLNNYLQLEFRNINDRGFNEINVKDVTLSKDTYTIGTFGTSIYVYDSESEKEYEIDYDSLKILEVGNKETGILYYVDGKKKRTSINNIDNISFKGTTSSSYSDSKYAKVDKVGIKYGYYYYYKKDGNKYTIYRSDINNSDLLTYVGTTTDIDKVYYADDFIYFINGNELYYYSDSTGKKVVIANNDLLTNKYTKLYVYIKKN